MFTSVRTYLGADAENPNTEGLLCWPGPKVAKTLMFSYIYGLELLKHVCFDTFHAQRAPQGPAVVPQGETGALCWVILVPGAQHWSYACSQSTSWGHSDAGPELLRAAQLPQPGWEFRLSLNPKRKERRADAHLAVWGGK